MRRTILGALRAPPQEVLRPPRYASPQELPAFYGPALNPPPSQLPQTAPPPTDPLRQAKISLTQELSSLKETLQQKREHVQLLKEMHALEAELNALMPRQNPKNFQKSSKPTKNTLMTFPVTHSQNPNPPMREDIIDEDEDDPPDSHSPPSADEASDTEGPRHTTNDTNNPIGQKYRRLNLKHIKDLKAAVTAYGPTAPYTLTILEGLSDRWLTPNDWLALACAALSGGDYVLWRTDFVENCRETAQRNGENKTSRSWTRDKLLGRSPYHTNEAQAAFPPGLLAQVQNAGLKAWRRLPPKGSTTTSLAKIHQGPEEPYCEFISRLTDAAERLVGEGENESAFVKHLAYENANPTCQAAIRPHRGGSLADYIKLCSGVGASHTLGLAIGALSKNLSQNKQKANNPKHVLAANNQGILAVIVHLRAKKANPRLINNHAPPFHGLSPL